jgi:subtilisin family serine protease
MPGVVFYNRNLLGQVDETDFIDQQGLGNDPLYKRFMSVEAVVKGHIDPKYQSFLSCPVYEDGDIFWYGDVWNEKPRILSGLSGPERERYDSIKSETVKHYQTVLTGLSGVEYQIMFGALKYISDDFIYCYDDKVVLVAWGMCPDPNKHETIGSFFRPATYFDKKRISFDVGIHGFIDTSKSERYQPFISREKGCRLSAKDIPVVKANDGYEFVGWDPEPIGFEVSNDFVFKAKYNKLPIPDPSVDDTPPADETVWVSFLSGEGGMLDGNVSIEVPKGYTLDEIDLPKAIANEGFRFSRWLPSLYDPINHDTTFTAEFEPNVAHCFFDSGEHGVIEGKADIVKPLGTSLSGSEIPKVVPHKGYSFTGWNLSPLAALTGDRVCVAQYKEEVLPWYKRWWLWLTGLFVGKGCLKWLLWLFLTLLFIILLSWLLRGCVGCTGHRAVNGVIPIDTVEGADGSYVEDNGYTHPITDGTGLLPGSDRVVAPVMGEGGVLPPVVEQPGMPNIMANRLFLFMEDENDDIESLAKDFKQAYPEDIYSIIGCDKEVKLLVIQIPEAERDHIRQTINSKIPNHKFIVFDEEVYEINGFISETEEDIGWHLQAIHLKQGWSITEGSPDVKVAVVDDGIQADHPMFKGRIVDAYNVFTQNNALSLGVGHGTHTAGLAVGSSEFYEKGAAGVAPHCKLMPIQVIDNKKCPLSALIAGVMYAVHHDADVVNISIGPSFPGLNVLPVDQQGEIAQSQFHNVAALWNRVCKLAAKKNTILVFAAGNDDILTSIPPENRNESSIVVTAVDKRMYPTVFTNYGPCSDVSAPGKSILSSFPTNGFQACDGTSMSAPIVTGTIALMKSLKRDITVSQTRNVLFSTGADVYGWIPPMVLVDKALEATRDGNFERVARESHSVPDDVDVHLHSGQVPTDEDGIAEITTPIANPVPAPQQGDGTDYDAIRRKIAEYRKKIEELEKLLPKE